MKHVSVVAGPAPSGPGPQYDAGGELASPRPDFPVDGARVVPIQILLVEDSPGDVSLTRHALARAKVANELHVVGDGEEAMAYLRREAPYEQATRPDLMLLDLNLPLKDGREVLAEMKSDARLAPIPVVVLTTSSEEADVLHAYRLHANSYVTKPVNLSEFLDAVRSIEGFWLSIVRLPPAQ